MENSANVLAQRAILPLVPLKAFMIRVDSEVPTTEEVIELVYSSNDCESFSFAGRPVLLSLGKRFRGEFYGAPDVALLHVQDGRDRVARRICFD